MKKYYLSLLLCATVMCSLNAQSTGKNPSFEEVISLRSGSNAQVSPDGRHVAFTVNSTDWQANRFDTEIWLSKDGAAPFPLTRTEASSSSSPSWSPTGQWIAFRASRGKNTQIWLISPQGGEAW
ncbi:MAG: PD40 domain-containing protein, partial [Lewinellaceae bacterium]|nr:PD40 domain-containing protein [Lewinellaceae bacterium]